MNRRLTGLAVAAVAALLALTGSAIAGGNGNGNNGNQPAAPAPAPAAAPAAPGNSANAPGQQKKTTAAPAAAPTKSSPAPGQAKKSSSTSSTAPGVKPSSTTKHWTHTTVGASPDVSKRYGNGKTAAQIAKSRGAPDNQPLTGPGNSQPHKTYDCRHKNNHSGGVDVHAIKSYSTTCTQQQQAAPQQSSQSSTQVCVGTTSVVTSTQVRAKKEERGHAYGEERKDRAEGKTKSTSVVVVQPASGCMSTASASQSTQAQAPLTAAVGASTFTQSSSPSTASAQQQSAGGVLGAQATLKRTAAPNAKPAAGGVLGAVGHIAGTTLPFTGLQLWIAVLIAIGLILVGSVLYRRGHGASNAL
jgi:hypothetical protein